MKKSKTHILKNSQIHTIEAKTHNHHLELAEELFINPLDNEGILADCYIKDIENQFKKVDDYD